MMYRYGSIVFAATFLQSTAAYAVGIVDNYCNDKATQGVWVHGLQSNGGVKNIANEFSPEHRHLVTFLDRLPVKTDEKSVLDGIPAKPASVIKVVQNSALYQWELPGSTYKLVVQVEFYKGCVTEIILMRMSDRTFFHRSNRLAVTQ